MKWFLYALRNEAWGNSLMESGTCLFQVLAKLCLGILSLVVLGLSKVLNVDILVLCPCIFSWKQSVRPGGRFCWKYFTASSPQANLYWSFSFRQSWDANNGSQCLMWCWSFTSRSARFWAFSRGSIILVFADPHTDIQYVKWDCMRELRSELRKSRDVRWNERAKVWNEDEMR